MGKRMRRDKTSWRCIPHKTLEQSVGKARQMTVREDGIGLCLPTATRRMKAEVCGWQVNFHGTGSEAVPWRFPKEGRD